MRVIICGAGIAGLALAHKLAATGAEIVVLERARAPREQGYMIDFYGPGYDAIEAMGLLPQLEKVAYPLSGAVLIDERGRESVGIEPPQFANTPLLNLMRPDLERVLRESLPSRVEVRYASSPRAVEDHGESVRVTLDDGTIVDGDLFVGADGIHSTVRRLVFGRESQFLRYLGFHTAAFIFDSPTIHRSVADRACLTDSIDAQMGFYGLRDGRVAAFAVHRDDNPELPDDARAAVRDTYGRLGWVIPEAIDACPPSDQMYYDQVAQTVMPRWTKGRVVLLGDAAYAVSLLAGLGASLAVAGAFVLADRLARNTSVDTALAEYERLLRPVIDDKQKVARSAARWFLPASPAQLRIRRATLRAARLPIVDRIVSKTLAGKPITLVKHLDEIRGAA
ncbi:MAG TPA: FAD-dependent monooxygenase [Stackebrandtia sp.]|jgi:2-polyprenyl-6-methoxyphenol hydroxylase-like FAD-dependent oxidoreductase|uniref:FAD-dependent monooxygenase n=1 Tax=Stackebrandtia sp. TaxID=2023065 RepID=UPI002D5B1139|nr:FAD-dependent monooxygenase [Stackebrandtia sp.]HZE39164.1 FAD-dependent monooxygenase [Stackebrandtia sp.]